MKLRGDQAPSKWKRIKSKRMKYLFFDTETNGLPKQYNDHVSNVENWPRMLQVAYALYEDDQKILERSFFIKPDGFVIDEEAAKIHGFTEELLQEKGLYIEDVLTIMYGHILKADILVAHNITFDKAIVGSEFIRNKMSQGYDQIKEKEMICTMKTTTKFCNIPGKFGPKWPKLEELHQKLFGVGIEGAHDAMVDVNALAKCFIQLKKIEVL